MHFDSLRLETDPTREQQEWIDRYREFEPPLEALGNLHAPFNDLCTRLLTERFGHYPVVAERLGDHHLTVELLPFVVPIIDEVVDLLIEERIVDVDGVWHIAPEAVPTGSEPPPIDLDSLGIRGTPLGERYSMVCLALAALDDERRTEVVDRVFTMVETNFMDHPAIATYYDTFQLGSELASVVVPLFEAVLAGECTPLD